MIFYFSFSSGNLIYFHNSGLQIPLRQASPTKIFPDRTFVDNDNHAQSFNYRPAPTIPQDLYYEACVSDPIEALERATVIGFPIMIKASEGGGGKGIRKASSSENFQSLFIQVKKYWNNNIE